MKSWIEHNLKLLFINFFRTIVIYWNRDFINFVTKLSVRFTYKMDSSKIKIMSEEIVKLFGKNITKEKIKEIIKRSLLISRKDLFETWMFPYLSKDMMNEIAYFDGKENLDNALTDGKGIIIMLTHFGFRKLILPALSYEGYKVHQLAAKPTSWKLKDGYSSAHDKIMAIELECENTLPVNFIYLDKSLRPVFKALNNNEILVIAVDSPLGSKRTGVNFFKRTAFFSTTPMSLSLKTGAAVLPAFVIRDKDDKHRIVFEKPLMIRNYQKTETGIEQSMIEYMEIFSRYVTKYPCHYADWLYRARLWPIEENHYIFE